MDKDGAGFVLDASVALAWCFEDERTPETQALMAGLEQAAVLVPAIWPLEVGNALLVAERRMRLRAEQTSAILDVLARLPIRVVPPGPTAELATLVALARDRGLATYDAAYLDLALRSGLALATLDARMRAAAASLGVPVRP